MAVSLVPDHSATCRADPSASRDKNARPDKSSLLGPSVRRAKSGHLVPSGKSVRNGHRDQSGPAAKSGLPVPSDNLAKIGHRAKIGPPRSIDLNAPLDNRDRNRPTKSHANRAGRDGTRSREVDTKVTLLTAWATSLDRTRATGRAIHGTMTEAAQTVRSLPVRRFIDRRPQ
jgi:hypothetical protein